MQRKGGGEAGARAAAVGADEAVRLRGQAQHAGDLAQVGADGARGARQRVGSGPPRGVAGDSSEKAAVTRSMDEG